MANSKYNKYTGARYVPLIKGEWDVGVEYEPLTVVTNQGTSYTSKRYVPKGVSLDNNEYWVVTGNYNAQVEVYRQEVKDLGMKVDSDFAMLDKRLQLHIEDFRLPGETDTDAFLKAAASGKTVLLDSKVYNVNSTLEMVNFTQFVGNNNTVIETSFSGESFIKLGHSCKLDKLKIITLNQINKIVDINTEHIKESIDYSTIYDFYSDIAVYNIVVNNVYIFKKSPSYGGHAFDIRSTGKGLNGWGITLQDIQVQGNVDRAFYFANEQLYNEEEQDVVVPWITDITVNNFKIVQAKKGITIEKNNPYNNPKEPQTPQLFKFNQVSMQHHANAEYFADIKAAKNVYFNECMPWDFNKSSNKPYKIGEQVADLKISNVYSYGVDETKGKTSENSNGYGTPFAAYGGGYSKNFLPTPMGPNEVYTMKQLYNLPVGTYEIPMDGSLSSRFSLPQTVTQYGATLIIEGGYLGRRNITLIPSAYNYTAKTPKFNKSIYILPLNFPRSQGSLDEFLDTVISRDSWLELKDIKNGIIPYGETSERPLLTTQDKVFEFFDTTLGKPIWWTGTKWVDSEGATI